MVVALKPEKDVRWSRTLQSADSLAEDLGVIGCWVGPRKGPDKRSHGQKEDYVLRRLLVAWKLAGKISFPVTIHADHARPGHPDFVMIWPDGTEHGVEITEAGEATYQEWLTRSEDSRDPAGVVQIPLHASTERTVDEFVKAITSKARGYQSGKYRSVATCDLAVYDNTAWGAFLDKPAIVASLRASLRMSPFRQIHLIFGSQVYVDVFGNDAARVDIAKAYETDYAGWLFEQVERLRRGELSELDRAHVAEELEDLGKSERRALASHLGVLLVHLLKWDFQSDRRTESWRLSIDNARSELDELLTESPSLRGDLEPQHAAAYSRARRRAALETGLPVEQFPESCPYAVEQILDPEFYGNG